MRIIFGLFFVAVIIACSGQQAIGQMRMSLDELMPEIVGNCFVYHLRVLDQYASTDDLRSKVCSLPKGWSPAAHAPHFLPIGLNSYYNAERASCGSYGCSSAGKDMRLILVGDPLPRAYVATSSGPVPAVNLVITTTLVDFIQRGGHSVMNDLLEDPQLAPEGLNAWLASLRALGGKSCSLPVKWTNLSLSPKIGEQTVYRLAGTTYQFLFAHEMAHLRTNQTCGYMNNPALTVEMNSQNVELACDKTAFDALARADMLMPIFTVGTFIGMQHYMTLKKPQLMAEFPGGPASFREAFPTLGFKERSQALVTAWRAVCSGGRAAAMCQMHEELAADALKIINSPPPLECVP